MAAKPWRARLVLLVKIALAVGILGFLLFQAQRHDSFANLRDQPKDWRYLAAAGALCLAGVSITLVRWFLLVWALGIPFRLKDAFRLGFLGYLLNFVSLGNVGGDLFKAVFIAREHPSRRTEAVATVVIDRAFGLYALFLVASAAILLTDIQTSVQDPAVQVIVHGTLAITAIGAVVIALLLSPGVLNQRLIGWLPRVKWVGPVLARAVGAIAIYQRKLPLLALVTAMSVVVHVLFVCGFYYISLGLPGAAPSFTEHFLAIPLSLVAGALPLTPNGLGTMEAGVEFFYQKVAAGGQIPIGGGVIAALCYRIITMGIAMIGVCYYLTRSREVDQAMHAAEANPPP